MGKTTSRAWRESPEGIRKYRETRARAQALADELGLDHGVEPLDHYQEWRHFMLPSRKYRFGHELSCEVVHPTRLDEKWNKLLSRGQEDEIRMALAQRFGIGDDGDALIE